MDSLKIFVVCRRKTFNICFYDFYKHVFLFFYVIIIYFWIPQFRFLSVQINYFSISWWLHSKLIFNLNQDEYTNITVN